MGFRRLRLLTALAPWLCGCFPFAVPPGYVEVGGSARRSDTRDGTSVDGPLQVRAAVSPLAIKSERPAPVDVCAGALFDRSYHDTTSGGYLEVGAFPWAHDIGHGALVRIEPRLQGRILYDSDSNAFGQGLAAQLSFEFTSFADGEFSSSSDSGGAFGYMHGESGIGIYVEGAYQVVQDRRFASASVGLQVRIPAMLGLAWALPH